MTGPRRPVEGEGGPIDQSTERARGPTTDEDATMPDPSRPDDPKPPIGDPASLFDTDELRPINPPPTPTPAGASDGYDLEVDPYAPARPAAGPDPAPLPTTGERPGARKARPAPEPEGDPATASTPVPPPTAARTPYPITDRPSASSSASSPGARPKARAAPEPGPTGDTSEFEAEVSVVDPIWTRGGEWGPDVARVAVAAVATLVVAWFLSGSLGLAFLALVLGGATTVLLSYPILITLERPVRITPQQAVTDYFAAASHHFPHYRRMWLLLSSAGRDSGPFGPFEDFRDHWKGRIAGWKAKGGAGKYTPLKFAVVDFLADKSTGKSTSKAEYTVHVLIRGKVQEGPVATFRMAHGLVKGPDRMWYLNQGVLASERK